MHGVYDRVDVSGKKSLMKYSDEFNNESDILESESFFSLFFVLFHRLLLKLPLFLLHHSIM